MGTSLVTQPLDFLASTEHPWGSFTNPSQVHVGKCCYRIFVLNPRPQPSAPPWSWREWCESGERRSPALVAVLHRWIFQAMRYPPQNLPPFFPAPGNLLQAQGDGKEKKRNIFPLPLKLSMPWSLKGRRGRCGCCNCKEQVLPILIFSF